MCIEQNALTRPTISKALTALKSGWSKKAAPEPANFLAVNLQISIIVGRILRKKANY